MAPGNLGICARYHAGRVDVTRRTTQADPGDIAGLLAADTRCFRCDVDFARQDAEIGRGRGGLRVDGHREPGKFSNQWRFLGGALVTREAINFLVI